MCHTLDDSSSNKAQSSHGDDDERDASEADPGNRVAEQRHAQQVIMTSSVGNAVDRSRPAHHALTLVVGKSAALILSALAEQPIRNGQLMRRISGISQKVLTETLRELERNGLVVREDLGTLPRHVDYSLSDLGRSLNDALTALDFWDLRNLAGRP
jgi:DNA-binding HxlR family transcriptional regulator